MAEEKFILFNVDIAGSDIYKKGKMIPYATAPAGPKFWCDGKHIQIDKRICFLVNSDREIIEKEPEPEVELPPGQKNQNIINDLMAEIKEEENEADMRFEDYIKNFDSIVDKSAVTKKGLPQCWGITMNGTQCVRAARENNRCMGHQDQAGPIN